MEARGLIRIRTDKNGAYVLEASLSGILFQEKETWVACCQMLDLSTCGSTAKEALENIREAISLFFDSCIKRNTLHRALLELHWICQTPDGALKNLEEGCLPAKIPPAFMIERFKKDGETWSGKVVLKDV